MREAPRWIAARSDRSCFDIITHLLIQVVLFHVVLFCVVLYSLQAPGIWLTVLFALEPRVFIITSGSSFTGVAWALRCDINTRFAGSIS